MTRTCHPLHRPRDRRAVPSTDRFSAVPPLPGGRAAHPDGTELAMEIRRGGARPVVTVSGELDLAGRELLEALLAHVRSTDPGTVALDLARVTFVDTHGLSPALEPDVELVAVSSAVDRLLRLLGLRAPGAPEPVPTLRRTAPPNPRRRSRDS